MDEPVSESHQTGVTILLDIEPATRLRGIGAVEILDEPIAFTYDVELPPQEVDPADESALPVDDVDLGLGFRKSVDHGGGPMADGRTTHGPAAPETDLPFSQTTFS